MYDNIILFAPKSSKINSFSFLDLNDFIDFGGNLLFGGTLNMSENMKSFASSCGVDFESEVIVDHFSSMFKIDER